jgi:hypothetical protein
VGGFFVVAGFVVLGCGVVGCVFVVAGFVVLGCGVVGLGGFFVVLGCGAVRFVCHGNLL